MVTEGQPLPDFTLLDQTGNAVSLSDLKGTPLIVYFYPKDDTSGCTAQACSLRDASDELGRRVIGVSPDSVTSHQKFATKFSLGFTLLADVDHTFAVACGTWVEKSMYGRTYMGVERSTILVDANGIVENVYRKVKPQNHAKFLLDELIAR